MGDINEWLSRGVRAFNHYNRYKHGILLKNDPMGGEVILKLVPVLLHINHPDLPGYIQGKTCPSGIKTMEWQPEFIKVLEKFLSNRIDLTNIQDYLPRDRNIEGIFTIGSVGSIGQTRDSDYDIWVIVDVQSVGKARLRLLETKIERLQRWITARFLIKVQFFLMDIFKIQANEFGVVSQEGAGSALKVLLKEEFYRTMTLIQGRIPLWWIVPPFSNSGVYEQASNTLHSINGLVHDDFIDLGDITLVPRQELFGATLWQMHKALDDPLKSVLKMALVSTYMDPDYYARLPCDTLKSQVFNSKAEDVVDPYIVAFQRIEDYYKSRGDYKTLDLLRQCFYIKVSPNIGENDIIKVHRQDKASIMVDVIKSWGWPLKRIQYLNKFNEWDIQGYQKFGNEIHKYLRKTAVLLIREAKKGLVHAGLEEDVDMEILRRRVEAFYVSKEGKIISEKRVQRDEPAYRELVFCYNSGTWKIFSSMPSKGCDEDSIMTSHRIAPIIAWLVYNRRFDASTVFHMVPNSSYIFLSDIQHLLVELRSFIPEASSIGLDRQSLLTPSYINRIFIIGNMEVSHQLKSIEEVDILYLNTWNELFSISIPPKGLKGWIKKAKRADTKINVWVSKKANSKQLVSSLVSLIS
ncbi:MAG: class I adenylate cyclase [Deltaproteobacteria bacterium]|nr:class I adenylate cyclase [Deltaproteobacteria bacterium]